MIQPSANRALTRTEDGGGTDEGHLEAREDLWGEGCRMAEGPSRGTGRMHDGRCVIQKERLLPGKRSSVSAKLGWMHQGDTGGQARNLRAETRETETGERDARVLSTEASVKSHVNF